MSQARWEVIGDKAVMRKLLRRAEKMDDVDRIAENSMKRIQLESFKRAPEKTGFLKSNLVAEENRRRTPNSESGSWDLVDGTDYTIIQEYSHRTKSAFLRNSIWLEGPKFKRDLEKLLKNGKW